MATINWVLDQSHSEIRFKVKHLMISSIAGKFTDFKGTVETQDAEFATAKVNFSAEINSISSNNEQRDNHLKDSDSLMRLPTRN